MKRVRGFTLFEIILTLIVLSMIAVGGVQWANRKHEETAAQQLGLRLFQYGMAVSEYARQNPDQYSSTKLPPNNLFGVEWLKNAPNKELCRDPNDLSTCETFLGKDFNFKFASYIYLAPLLEGVEDAQIHVQFETPTSPTSGPLKVHLITVGKVYRFTNSAQPYSINISLDSRAVNFANQYHDKHGTAEITYTLAPLDENAMITGVPSTTAPHIDSGYLRTDGSNEMDNSIRFSASAATKNVENVDTIHFKNAEDVNIIRFSSAAGSSRSLDNVGTINFANARLFRGIRTDGPFELRKDGMKDLPNTPNSLCFITRIEYGDNASGLLRKCAVDNSTHKLTASNAHYCAASCLIWD